MKRKGAPTERGISMAFLATVLVMTMGLGLFGGLASADCPDDEEFTREFRLEACTFKATGENPYFRLIPGYQLILEGEEESVQIRAEVTVLRDTEWIDLKDEGIGMVETTVVEEREYEDGDLIEVSRNFFALCEETNSVYYFGEDVDDYEDGVIVGHEGAWRAGENGAMPGLMMPGTFLLGSKYFQEIAEADGAIDRGENTEMGLTVDTEAGTFHDCVLVVDTNPAEGICDPDDGDEKIYCPGVGLVQDEELELVSFGKEEDEATICATLGNDGFRRDEDMFGFSGMEGEAVTVRLEADPPEAGAGKPATLILRNKTGRLWLLFRRQVMELPQEITATLPVSGEYHVTVAEQLSAPWGQGYNGAYCVTLEGTPETSQTFEALSVD